MMGFPVAVSILSSPYLCLSSRIDKFVRALGGKNYDTSCSCLITNTFSYINDVLVRQGLSSNMSTCIAMCEAFVVVWYIA